MSAPPPTRMTWSLVQPDPRDVARLDPVVAEPAALAAHHRRLAVAEGILVAARAHARLASRLLLRAREEECGEAAAERRLLAARGVVAEARAGVLAVQRGLAVQRELEEGRELARLEADDRAARGLERG